MNNDQSLMPLTVAAYPVNTGKAANQTRTPTGEKQTQLRLNGLSG